MLSFSPHMSFERQGISIPILSIRNVLGREEKLRTSLTFYSLVNDVAQITAQALSLETKMQSLSKMSQEIEIQLWAF